MSGPDSDADLIRWAVEGDAFALERLLFTHYDRLRGRIERKIPAAMRAVVSAEDVLQQALTDAFLRITSFAPGNSRAFYRWLLTIADHQLADMVRAGRAIKRGGGRAPINLAPASGFDSSVEIIDLLAGSVRSPSQSAARQEAIAAIHIGLASLKEDYRQAIQLRYVQGLPAAEVAKLMGKSPHAIHHLCHRGLKELHAVMGRSSQYLSKR